MAKKFVRGVTGVDDIEKLDKTVTTANNVDNNYVITFSDII